MLGGQSRAADSRSPVGHAAGHRGRAGTRKAGTYARTYTSGVGAVGASPRPVSSPAAATPARPAPRRRPAAAAGAGCAPVAGDAARRPQDDKKLQNTDNIIPAINTKAANPQLIAALDKVSAALDTAEADRSSTRRSTSTARRPRSRPRSSPPRNNLTAGIAKGPGGNITVGAANFSESQTLGELYRIVLTAAGYTGQGAADRQPRALRAGAGEGRHPGRPGVRGHPGRVPQQQGQRQGRQPVASPRPRHDGDRAEGRWATRPASSSASRPRRRTRTRSRSPRRSPTSTA